MRDVLQNLNLYCILNENICLVKNRLYHNVFLLKSHHCVLFWQNSKCEGQY